MQDDSRESRLSKGQLDAAEKHGIPVAFENSIGMSFVLIPAGEFMLGSNDGYDDEKPVHRVRITKPFYMGVTEVTQRQYDWVVGENPSYFKGADNPVEQVSWSAVTEFCKIMSQRAQKTVRLPTEAEWEYACRAGSTGKYCFGNSERQLGDYAWYDDNSGNKTHPVGQKKPNAWGLYDMHGSVLEWCADWYGEYPPGEVSDPTGPSTGRYRVVRGGSWRYYANYSRSANRYYCDPTFTYFSLGFRVVFCE